MRFGKKGNLNPRFFGSFEVLEKIGVTAYRLAVPPLLSAVHNVFYVPMLRKYIPDTSHVLSYEPLPLNQDQAYREKPTRIIDTK